MSVLSVCYPSVVGLASLGEAAAEGHNLQVSTLGFQEARRRAMVGGLEFGISGLEVRRLYVADSQPQDPGSQTAASGLPTVLFFSLKLETFSAERSTRRIPATLLDSRNPGPGGASRTKGQSSARMPQHQPHVSIHLDQTIRRLQHVPGR